MQIFEVFFWSPPNFSFMALSYVLAFAMASILVSDPDLPFLKGPVLSSLQKANFEVLF